jgi:hypothetical protein
MAETSSNVAIVATGTTIATAKQEFEARSKYIEQNLYTALQNGTVQSVDFDIYATRHLESDTTIELMQSSDSKKVGITNINDRKLEANTYAFITGIQILEATVTANTEAALSAADYGVIDAIVANGELEIKNGDKILIPRTSMSRFRTTGQGANGLNGYVQLECPKFLLPLTDITPTLYLPKSVENKAIRLVLHGVKTNKA